MGGDRHILKKILVIDIVIVSYVLLTSTIIQYRSERKVSDVVAQSIAEWSRKNFEEHRETVEREKRLSAAADPELARRLAGAVLLQVESRGEAWYVNPQDQRRYYLGRPRDAQLLIRAFAREIGGKELLDYLYFDQAFPSEFAGRFVHNPENPNHYYYIDPKDRSGHLLSYPNESFAVLTGRGVGIKNEAIRQIPVGELK